jgi:hypothetical protein
MKKILLIGDSIRMGYCEYVKESLSDSAIVYYPPENCKFAVNVLRFMKEWKVSRRCSWPTDMDAVVFNAGLWDVLRIQDGEMLSTIEYYTYIMERLGKVIKELFPVAKITFASTTAIVEEGSGKRFNKDIEEFNEAAIKVLKPLGIEILDLYSITKAIAPDSKLRSDETHFNTDEGRKLIGGAVTQYLASTLGIAAKECDGKDMGYPTEAPIFEEDDIGY